MGRFLSKLGCSAVVLSGAILTFVHAPNAQAQIAPIISCDGRVVTSLSFSAPTLQSGTDLQIGAVYRFQNVATGVDALIEIIGFANGGSLATIDTDTGLVNNFQPELNTSASGTGAADFLISFVQSGTTTPINLDIAASSIDVDGNNQNIREYVEYQDTSSGFILNSTTELDRNASGPTAGRNRYESRTSLVAPGIDPTAEDNIVIVFYTDVSSFEFRMGTLGAGNMTRLTSQGYDCPNLSSPVTTMEVSEDFGDALLNNYGNPIHTIVPGIQMGTTNTVETSSGNSPTANSDAGDDGVTLPDFVVGGISNVAVNVTGTGGYLQAWIDWNNDGDFQDSGEQVATNEQDTDNDGVINLSIATPSTATVGATIARLRWSTALSVSYQEPALDGEVEDYLGTILAAPPLSCPAGYSLQTQNGYAGTVIVSVQNANRALGPLASAGTSATAVSARLLSGNNQNLTLQLEDLVPENADIVISIARDNQNGIVNIEGSFDGNTFVPLGAFGAGTQDILQQITLTSPAGGMEFIRFLRTQGRVWVDGVSYSDICSPPAIITGSKTVDVYDPTNSGTVYALPGNDVVYTISAANTGGGAVDTDSVVLIDALPPEIEFFNGDMDEGGPAADPVLFTQSTGAGLDFVYSRDVRFGLGPTIPADFSSCTTIAPDATYRADFQFICFNPKGALNAGDPDPTFSVGFRARIK